MAGTKVYPVADLVLPIRSPAAGAWRESAKSQASWQPDLGNLSRIVNPVQMEVIDGLDVLVFARTHRTWNS